jgi:hypothetical protein
VGEHNAEEDDDHDQIDPSTASSATIMPRYSAPRQAYGIIRKDHDDC